MGLLVVGSVAYDDIEAPTGKVTGVLGGACSYFAVAASYLAPVSVVGVSMHPRLARIVAAALEQSGLTVGKDIDRFAFAHGSDHWPFHLAGIPAVDLWSGDYGVMHTKTDTPDGVDEQKVTRIGRALALAVMALAGGF